MPSNKISRSIKPGTTKKNKTNDLCLSHLRAKWRNIITKRFDYFFEKSPECSQRMGRIMDCMVQGLESLFLKFSDSDLKDTQFNTQVMLEDAGAYPQRMAEMLFYYRLLGMGFDNFKSKDAGPDFIAQKDGQTFCFEVVTPTPNATVRELIEQRELSPEERDLIFRERLLSTTSAIKDKLKKFELHKKGRHVPEGAHYIIVVNDSLLLPYDQPWYGVLAELCYGDSTLPIVADATLGCWEIDFSELYGETPEVGVDESVHNLIMKSNIGISLNGGQPVTPDDSLLKVKIRKKIPTRTESDTIIVDIAESVGVAGIYQITLREDLMFYHSFPSGRKVMPASALISAAKNKQLVRKSIFHTSTYSKDENFAQPNMSPARMFGIEPDDFNNKMIYDNFFKPYISGGEFYEPPTP